MKKTLKKLKLVKETLLHTVAGGLTVQNDTNTCGCTPPPPAATN